MSGNYAVLTPHTKQNMYLKIIKANKLKLSLTLDSQKLHYSLHLNQTKEGQDIQHCTYIIIF